MYDVVLAGQTISQVGDGVSKVALLWFVYAMTDSALKMSLIGVLQTIPPLAFGPFAGVLLDRLDKRRAMIVIDLARTGLLASILLHAFGLLTLPWLYVLVFVIAMFSMAFGPALNATLPLIVKKEQLTGVNALMQSAMTIGQLLGPALSGILIAAIGAENALYVNAAAFFLSGDSKIPLRLPHVRVHRSSDRLWSASRKGSERRDPFRFFVKQRLLFLLMIVASIVTLGSTAFVYLLPVIGNRLLHGAVALGWLVVVVEPGNSCHHSGLIWKPQQTVCMRIWMIAIAR